jgi:hypothetical protein
MARKYTKKNSDYWDNRKQNPQNVPLQSLPKQAEAETVNYGFDNENHFSAFAACHNGATSQYRDGISKSIFPIDAYKNIDAGLLPWELSNGSVSVSRAIILAQKAYANVSVIKTSIESSVEFSNAELYIDSDNKTVYDFFTEWFNIINIYKVKDNVFREYYRSGNVPIYKFFGRIGKEDFGRMQSVFGAIDPNLPIRYTVLNPSQVAVQNGLGYDNNYVKILSNYEIEKLKNPQTPQDKQVFNSLPPEVKKTIKAGGSFNNVLIPLDPDKLVMLFYKKQDYEPMAMPMIFPVLNDIEWKLELKKMDMTVGRMIEHAILLVTAGEKADQWNTRYNPQNIINLQNIFRNQSLGRVLVGDYTTKAEWIIPPIDKILGPEKYKQVESDIREGVQSIIMGEDKFANAQIKARVFIERMKEGQKAFLNNFLIPEIKMICEKMNFRNVPDVRFAEINLNDPSTISRVYLRLAELGILSPEEVIDAIETGILPNKATNIANQKQFKELKDEGLYSPLLGGPKIDPAGRPAGTGTPKSDKKVVPQGMASEERYDADKIAKIIPLANELKENIAKALKKKFKIKASLNEDQLNAAQSLAKTIIGHESIDKWNESIGSYINTLPTLKESVAKEIDNIMLQYDMQEWDALIVWKSKQV